MNAVVSPAGQGILAYAVQTDPLDPLDFCPGNPDFIVVVTDLNGNLVQGPFSIQAN